MGRIIQSVRDQTLIKTFRMTEGHTCLQSESVLKTIRIEYDRGQRTSSLVGCPHHTPDLDRTEPFLVPILSHSVASATTLNEAKKTPGCLYYAMPVQQFETLGGFSKFNEVYAVGLEASREVLKQWKQEGKLPTGLVDDVQAKSQAVKRGTRLR